MYYGNCGGNGNVKIENEEKLVLDVIIECEEILLKKLSQKPEILEAYKKLDVAMGELACIENERSYAEGYKFGFLMAMDIFDI